MEDIRKSANKVFSDIAKRVQPEDDDFYGNDGLLYCGKCRCRKEKRLMMPDLGTPGAKREAIVPVVCQCRKEELDKIARRHEHEEEVRRLDSLKRSSLMDEKLRNATFSMYDRNGDNQKLIAVAQRYVDQFPQMLEDNQGLMFYGPVGTGKSYTAACIANELMERKVTVIMTSFVKILQEIQNPQTDEREFLARLNSPKLLVIDDLGTERNTDYALEKVYSVIDSRYRSKMPLILTTNMTLKDMQQTSDIRYRRVYDRIFEMCYPVRTTGKSWRESEAARRYDRMKELLGG